MRKSKVLKRVVLVILILLLVGGGVGFAFKDKIFKKKPSVDINTEKVSNIKSEYQMYGNNLEDFDLEFLKLENKSQNIVYSPLSMKFALEMLNEGTNGRSREQISAILGKYTAKKFINTSNMSFANAMFIKNSFEKSVKKSYIDNLKSKYAAEVIFDSFNNPKNINSWVKDKTLGLIDNIYDDVSDLDFILLNALAIDMEWENVIQIEQACQDGYSDCKVKGLGYMLDYKHEGIDNGFVDFIGLFESERKNVKFDNKKDVVAPEFAAVINNYDIIKELGEENIRKTVKEALGKWKLENPDWSSEFPGWYDDEEKYLDEYIKDISKNYGDNGYSTDFYVYDDENVKVFAKDLKSYSNTTLEYVGIMPKEMKLDEYIKEVNAKDLKNIFNNLKDVSIASNFEDGVFTYITGAVPLFNFDYEIDMIGDLKKLGVSDVFFEKNADLTNMVDGKGEFISDVTHKATINFSNEGIKAGAVTLVGGYGDAFDGFDYIFKMPVKEIDLTFDKPYMFLIRDTKTGEIWFAGSVYDPTMND